MGAHRFSSTSTTNGDDSIGIPYISSGTSSTAAAATTTATNATAPQRSAVAAYSAGGGSSSCVNARSTPNLPTSTPVHYKQLHQLPQVGRTPPPPPPPLSLRNLEYGVQYHPSSHYSSHHHRPISISSTTNSSTTSPTSTSSGGGGSSGSNQLSPVYTYSNSATAAAATTAGKTSAVAEDKLVGRGITRSNASYGIQQMLQEQVSLRTIVKTQLNKLQ